MTKCQAVLRDVKIIIKLIVASEHPERDKFLELQKNAPRGVSQPGNQIRLYVVVK